MAWSGGISLKGSPGAQLRTGTGAPSSSNPAHQNDGDSYLDTATGNLYATRQNGAWPASPSANIVGAQGQQSIISVNAPPGANAGAVGQYALYTDANGIVWLYGPKTGTGWPQVGGVSGSSSPLGTQLTGQQGAPGAAGLSVLTGSGAPANTLGADGQPGYIDTSDPTTPKLYGPKAAGAWPSTYVALTGPLLLTTSGAPAASVGAAGSYAIDQVQAALYGPKDPVSGWPATPINIVGPAGPPGPQGPAGTFPSDITANSLSLAPVAGDATASTISQMSGTGATLFASDGSGNVTVAGNLSVAGATTLAGTTTGALTSASHTVTNNATVGGTLGVTGTTTLAGTTTGALTSASHTVTNNATVGGTLGVTGATTASTITASGLITAPSITLASGGGGKLTFADGTSMTTAATGTGGGGSTGGTGGMPSRSVVFLGSYWNSAYTANASASTYHATVNNNGNGLGETGAPFRFDISGAVVGYSLNQAGPVTGTNTIQFYKNGSPFGAAIAAGAGNTSFAGTFPNSTYTFSPGDVLTAYVSNSTAGNTQITLHVTIEWLGSSAGGAASMDLGFYWPNAGAYPTTPTVNTRAITNGGTVATVQAVNTVQSAGSILGINGLIFGNTGGGTYTFTLYKNGVATGIQATASSTAATQTNSLGTVWQSASGSAAVNYAPGDYFQIFSSATSGSTSQATYSYATYFTAASSVISTAGSSIPSRSFLDMGGIYNTSLSTASTAFYGIYKGYLNANSPSTYSAPALYDHRVKVPFPCSIVGWHLNNQVSSTAYFQYFKNGSVMGSTVTAGTGSGLFWGSHPAGTYTLAAGDDIGVKVNTNNATYNLEVTVVVQWSA